MMALPLWRVLSHLPSPPWRIAVTEQAKGQFYLGKITDGAGNEIADEAFLTFGSAHGQNDGDCEIKIKGGRAHEAADLISAIERLRAQRDELREVLKQLFDFCVNVNDIRRDSRLMLKVGAVIAAVEDKT